MYITFELAQQLKSAGLEWRPSVHDFFFVPDTDISDRIFVLTDVMANYEILRGLPAITFNGVVEWALDYVLQSEATWLPSEAQLRTLIERFIGSDGVLALQRTEDGYRCTIQRAEEPLLFQAVTAADAYAQALLALLRARQA